ncbi:Fe-S oxidoreductase [Zalaria obscura]|uniref:Fe-S oxidoreductase n=1 Tax=Zalaria obscura TaxID=2024903 RepID=A0ACC3SLU3_9PEZI
MVRYILCPANGAFYADHPAELLVFWHTYRSEILLSAALIYTIVRLTAYWRSARTKQSLTPPISPTLKSIEKEEVIPIAVPAEEKAELRDADHLLDVTPIATVPIRPKAGPKRVTGTKTPRPAGSRRKSSEEASAQIQPIIFYYTVTTTTEQTARKLVEKLGADITSHIPQDGRKCLQPLLRDLADLDYDDYFISPPKTHESGLPTQYFYLILTPSYNIDTELSNFLDHLQETHNDFRIDTAPLSPLLGYSVFGFGDREGWPTEEEGFCSQAKEVDKWMARLTGKKRAFPLGMGDVKSDAKERLQEWQTGVVDVLKDLAEGKGLGEGVKGSGDAVESDEEDIAEDSDEEETDETKTKKTTRKPDNTADLEDLGGKSAPLAVDFTTYKNKKTVPPSTEPKEMVPKTSPTYTALTKQGYTIVGSHSGVKICRWTKSALRGRGSCYKFSFYGIRSHLCMETTPALSCSNKCVFCWRHGTNPVGTTWRWKVDPPEEIFKGVKEGHYKKIKMMKGVPGVRAERFAEAMRIRHCALSLVGEPIFYPHINEFTAMLHAERISSFLVCNAQHPDQLAALKPVTQLYVSIDASNKETLRKIDRPLHRDFWERFQRCLDILREKRDRQRTVFRLTLVKGFNIDDEAEEYAGLVERALPGLVEVKGVTYCGTSTSSAAGLTMQNVPFYEEVCAFVEALVGALKRRGLDYGIAAEHAHSCCILIADTKRFKRDDGWHTLIDYEKFFEHLESGKEFGPQDYISEEPNPTWSQWGMGGFNPEDERVDRKGRKKDPDSIKVGGGRVVEIA